MRTLSLILVAASTLALSDARAEGAGLQGLEMDVMEAGESPGQATARIALPGASATIDDGKPEDGELVTEQNRPGSNAREAEAVDTAGPMGPEPATDTADGLGADTTDSFDVGEPDVGDGVGVDGGGIAEDPIDPGVLDGEPGVIGIIEPGGGSIDDTPVDEPPVEEPPVEEIPIGELPGDGTTIDEPPEDGIPTDGGVDGDPTGGDGVSIMPEQVEPLDGLQPRTDDISGISSSDRRS